MTLVLFDIDGTLMRGAPPVHRQALCDAAREVYGVTLTMADFGATAGMTDRAIGRRELRAAGVADDEITAGLAPFCEAAASAYDCLAPDDLSAYHTPHAQETLDWLRECGATLGLVTGNIERIAWRKLGAAGLATAFIQPAPRADANWSVAPWIGGFGDQHEDRARLPQLAMARATTLLGAQPHPRATWIIGDTPADIACGVDNGLRVIAVATGSSHTYEALAACEPEIIVRNLGEMRALGSQLFAD